MLKARGKLISLLTACMALVLTLVMGIATLSIQPKVASAADTRIVFTLGADGSASHADGSSKTSYSETVSGYTLSLTNVSNFYTGARDAKGNGCIKLGASSKAGGFTLTAPAEVTSVVIAVAQYKANTTKITVNGTAYTITTASTNGAYTDIIVDTTSTKTITLTTVSGGYRAMVNTITFVIPAAETDCKHENTTTTTVDATCTTNGSVTTSCNDCDYVEEETIPATGHNYVDVEGSIVGATCTENGSKQVKCSACGDEKEESIPAMGHNYVDGSCSACGEEAPLERELVFDDTAKRTTYTTSQQIWEDNGVIFTNNKESSTNAVADYAKPVRLYAGSSIIIECDSNIAKIVFNCNTSAYATALKNSIDATATVNDKVVTVELDGSANEYTVAKLTAQVRIDSLTVTLVKKADAGCAHENVTTTTVKATCTEEGSKTVICNDCGGQVGEVEILPALGHNYVDDFCQNEDCGKQDPATVDYSGYYYISFTHSETVYYADNSQLSNNRYYAKAELPSVHAVELKYVYRLEKMGMNGELGIYSLYEIDGDCYQDNILIEMVEGTYRFYATVDGDSCQLLLNASGETKYIKFYKNSNATQTNYAQDITLTAVEIAGIDSASVTLGEDVALNYYVTMADGLKNVIMNFTMNGEVYDRELTEQTDGRYKVSLELPPQYMANVIKVDLVVDGVVVETMDYSIKQYAQAKLMDSKSSNELKMLLSDMLYYGAAAQTYKGYNLDNLATDGVKDLLEASTLAPETTDFTLISNDEITEYPAYFKGAGVHFADVNKIYVKLSTTENVTLTINGEEVAVTGTTVYTDGILATQFADTYTFVLSCDGVVMQTLTYSVNAYAYAKQGESAMGKLALALYHYGESAKAYHG